LGASRGRILRQLLTESLMLSLAGGALGMLFASWGNASILAFIASNQDGPTRLTPSINTHVLLFTAAVSMFTGILFGLAPALRGMRVDLTPGLKEGAGGGSHTKRAGKGWLSAGNGLVVAQVALSIVVLAGAGLLMRTLQNLKNVDPGFDTRNVLTFSLDPTLTGYKPADTNNLYRELQSRLAAMPGVMSVSYSWSSLLGNSLWTSSFHIPGKPKDEESDTDVMPVGSGFFGTMRIRLLAGREFTAADFARAQLIAAAESARQAREAAAQKSKLPAKTASEENLPPLPAIVNQTFVKHYFPTVNPVGQIFGASEADPEKDTRKTAGNEIVGVVSDAKYNRLRRDIQPTTYLPENGGAVSFALRTATDPTNFVPQVRAVVNQMDSDLPVFQIRTESQQIERQIFKERLIARLSGFFGALALLLACIGLYGLVSYEVARRTREIGIRAALGADRRAVLRLVLSQGMRLALVGAIVGIALALGLTRYAKDLLYGVKAADPVTYIAVALLLFGVTLAACYAPARRATRVDPVVALRYE
jgi:predicted permease